MSLYDILSALRALPAPAPVQEPPVSPDVLRSLGLI